jgi:hypothetical protein
MFPQVTNKNRQQIHSIDDLNV